MAAGENDRHEQLRRQWRTRLKYQREFTPAEASELRDTVGELLAEAVQAQQLRNEVERLEREVEDYELDRELDYGREELKEQIDDGPGSFLLCTSEPCWRIYRILPTARETAAR